MIGKVHNSTQTNSESTSVRFGKEKFDLCTSLIRDACVSRLEIPYKRDPRSVQMHNRFYARWSIWMYYFFTIINLSTVLLEHPATITFNGRAAPFYVPLIINFVCELYFYYRVYVIHTVTDRTKFSGGYIRSHASVIILALMTFDAVVFAVLNLLQFNYVIRWSRSLRPILLLTFPEFRRLRSAFDNIRQTAVDVIPVFSMFLSSIAFLSIVSVSIFRNLNLHHPDGKPYLDNIWDALWDLYVLTTTANSPDVIIPAYEHNRAFIIMYVLVCGICNWLFMGILTASVYNSYKAHLGEFVTSTVSKRKAKLDEAFGLYATPTENGKEMGIDYPTFVKLLKVVKPHMSLDRASALFHILDKDRNGLLEKNEFGRVSEYLQASLSEVELSREHFQNYVPRFYDIFMKEWFQTFRRCVHHPVTHMFFTAMTVGNAITAVAFLSFPKIQAVIEWMFTIVFLFELCINYLACGGVDFFAEKWNLFDTAVVSSALIGQMLQESLAFFGIVLHHGITQLLLLVRIFRLLKLFSAIRNFRVVIKCILTILPSLAAYTAILLILFYIYSCIGMELFADLFNIPDPLEYTQNTTCHSPFLANTTYVHFHYCIFNFNNVASAFLILLINTVGNNWNIFSEGHAKVTGIWAGLFFAFIQWTCVLLVLNIVLAFIIEAFLIEYDSQQSRFESYIRQRLNEVKMNAEVELERRGLQDYGKPGFYITRDMLDSAFPPDAPAAKAFILHTEVTSIEILLFRMFENEIEELMVQYRRSKAKPMLHTRDVLNV